MTTGTRRITTNMAESKIGIGGSVLWRIGQRVSYAANFGFGVRIARGRAIFVRWSPCWSLILPVSQSRRAGFGRAAEEQRENNGKAEDDR